ncbi:MAG: hypothetical protein JWP97_250, partial [Labilithrix sp.]|nr:hypothetical protein [Labilithrix sp.]
VLDPLDAAVPELAAPHERPGGDGNGTPGERLDPEKPAENAIPAKVLVARRAFDSSYGGSNPPVGTNNAR